MAHHFQFDCYSDDEYDEPEREYSRSDHLAGWHAENECDDYSDDDFEEDQDACVDDAEDADDTEDTEKLEDK